MRRSSDDHFLAGRRQCHSGDEVIDCLPTDRVAADGCAWCPATRMRTRRRTSASSSLSTLRLTLKPGKNLLSSRCARLRGGWTWASHADHSCSIIMRVEPRSAPRRTVARADGVQAAHAYIGQCARIAVRQERPPLVFFPRFTRNGHPSVQRGSRKLCR